MRPVPSGAPAAFGAGAGLAGSAAGRPASSLRVRLNEATDDRCRWALKSDGPHGFEPVRGAALQSTDSSPIEQMEQMDHSSFTVTARLPIGKDEFAISVYSDPRTRLEHIVLVLGSVGGPTEAPVFVRIHSECITGDLFGSKRCDCGAQLEEAVRIISARKRGILIYLRQEGRGIGLVRKLRAYNLQDEGLDTVEANLALGHLPDERSFAAAAEILSILDVEKIELFTNNPAKVSELAAAGTNIVSVIHSSPAVTPYNRAYIKTKIDKLGHVFAQSRVLDDLA